MRKCFTFGSIIVAFNHCFNLKQFHNTHNLTQQMEMKPNQEQSSVSCKIPDSIHILLDLNELYKSRGFHAGIKLSPNFSDP